MKNPSHQPNNDQLRIYLNEGTLIREGATVTLTYDQPLTGGLQDDDAGNQVVGFTISVTNNVDVAPLVEKVTVIGRVLTIDFDQLLHDDAEDLPPPNCEKLKEEEEEDEEIDCSEPGAFTWFTVQRKETGSASIDAVSVAAATVTLLLGDRIGRNDSVTVEYSPQDYDGSSRNLRDTSEDANQVNAFGPREAINQSAAHPTRASVDRSIPTTLDITFDGNLQTEAEVDASAMELMVNEQSITSFDATSTDDTLTIHLPSDIPECASVTFSYYASDGSWQDDRGHAIQTIRNLIVDNLIEPDWGLKCIRSEVGKVMLTFAESWVPGNDGWNLTVNGQSREPNLLVSKNVVTLSPTRPVCLGDVIDISHSASGKQHSHSRRISSAAPCALSVVSDRTTMTITFDQPLGSARPAPTDFTLTGSASIEAVTGVDGDVLTLRLSAPGLHVKEKAQLRYPSPTLSGTELTFAPFVLDVDIEPVPPEIKSAIGFRSWISLEFDQQLNPRSIAASRFILHISGHDDINVQSVEVSGASVLLELSQDLPDDEKSIVVVYLSKSSGGLESLLGARVTDSVFIVENLTETAPSIASAVADDQAITVTFDQGIKADGTEPSDFHVVAGRRAIAAASLEWSHDGVVIALAERITSLDGVRLIYAPATPGSVRDLSGLALKPFQFWAENRTPHPTTLQARIEDAKLRSSNGLTTVERELVRGFAGDDGIQASLEPGEGWTTIVQGELTVSVDAASLGDESVRIYAAPLLQTSHLLEQIGAAPSLCMIDTSASGASGWWIGQSDLHGVPTDVNFRVRVSGPDMNAWPTSYCVLDLISGSWRLRKLDGIVTGPTLILKQSSGFQAIEALLSLAR